MLPTPYFWHNLDLKTDYSTGVLSMAGKVRKWLEAEACLSAASYSVFLYWGAQKSSVSGADKRQSLLLKLQTVLNQLLKNQLPLGGRLFILLAHLFPHLTESGTWKPLCFDCILILLGKALALHQQFTLQGSSSVWFSEGVLNTSVWKIQTVNYCLQIIIMLKPKARKLSGFSQ